MTNLITYAIGDIHGENALFEAALAAIELDSARLGGGARVVILGDFVDRGPDTSAVIERLRRGPTRHGDAWIVLKGNHEHNYADSLRRWPRMVNWMRRSMLETIESYGTDLDVLIDTRMRLLPPDMRRHAAYLDSLPLFHDDGKYLFVHAGIRPYVPLDNQSENDMLWIRDDFTEHRGHLDRIVVHGHTVCGPRPTDYGNRIALDTGAYLTGRLSFAAFGADGVRYFQAIKTGGAISVTSVEPLGADNLATVA